MSDNTGIEWADATWNPIIGCTKVSPGCDNCYAIRTAHRMTANPNPKISTAYAGTELNGDWTNQINLLPDRLDIPLRWRKPRRIFVNSQSDLFHKNVPDHFIAQVWAVMALAQQHTFQILTKRPGRMRSLLTSEHFKDLVAIEMAGPLNPNPRASLDLHWPRRNVWLGTSVEDQKWADIRIPALLDTPAAIRFLSCEPLLGPVNLTKAIEPTFARHGYKDLTRLHWVIAGGESGPGARPMHPNWTRELRDQCATAGIPFHFKQWGEWAPDDYSHATHLIQELNGTCVFRKSATVKDSYGSGSGTQDLVDRGHPGWARITRKGKRFAGRLLDGETWDQYPQPVVTP